MRLKDGIFLSGIMLITLLSSTILLLFSEETEDIFLPIVKLAMGIWIIQSIFILFGHSLL
ncbi:hypothetical protein H4683_000855 [Filibacter limicola]|uniref:Uncharacterized protein n=1 Tax=Sporosarcina limicola TaxID=34101 RepID=A0A927MM75_9BACL|nr:hypothetical protein [Sporosarcina limicola]